MDDDSESPLQIVKRVGVELGNRSRPNKDFLVKTLKEAAVALSQTEQSFSLDPSKKKQLFRDAELSIKPLRQSIVKLLSHADKDVRILVAICVTEVFRILATDKPPFEDKDLRGIFTLIINMFRELVDPTTIYFSKRAKILETVARYKFYLIMMDDCFDLVFEMFNVFFSVVSEHHQQSVITDILSIMTHILNEEASEPLVDIVMQNLIKEGKGSASSQLAASAIKSCAERLEPLICGFLESCFLDRDAVSSDLKEVYHEIMFKVYQCAPHMFRRVIPYLTQELLTEQVDVRIKAVNLMGKLLSLPEHHIYQKHHDLFKEFLKRFSDKSLEVRLAALQSGQICYMARPSGAESGEVLAALQGRLLDFDDKVRAQAIVVACDLAKSNLKFIPPKLVLEIAERLRDKKISVRKKAFQKLMEVYQDYCNKCSEGFMTISDHFEQIPCKILMLIYDRDCKEFRSQNLELVLADDLFPALLSVKERTRHWVHLFSLFNPRHLKALNFILAQKQRLQTEMQNYLALRKKEKDDGSEETQKKIRSLFIKLSACFPEPTKAEECFHKLNHLKDNNIFNALSLILEEQRISIALATKDKLLKTIGEKHPNFEFLRLLSSKCLFNIFSSEHVNCILDYLLCFCTGNQQLATSSIKLIEVIITVFPSLMKGSEAEFQLLFEGNDLITDKLIEILAKTGPHISAKLSDYPILKRLCLEGTRTQSKHAVAAIASLIDDSEQFVLSELCKELVESLESGRNVPTVLQALGCIAQISVSAFEAQNGKIKSYIYENIFQSEPAEDAASFDETSGCSASCKLKIYALKMIVKSYLPHQGSSQYQHKIKEILDILSKVLQKSEQVDSVLSSENDETYIRLAAAKSVLQLSRKWDFHLSPGIFRYTVLMAKDPSPFARRKFLDKTRKMLKQRAIPRRYACAFVLAFSDCLTDLQTDSIKYMAEFIKEYTRQARTQQPSSKPEGALTDHPAYVVVFLIHILAHDNSFPLEDCQDEEIFAQFCCPLFSLLQSLMDANIVDGNKDFVTDASLNLMSIFRAIKRAVDAIDAKKTPRLHILSEVGTSILNALKPNSVSPHNSPELVYLPSLFYGVDASKKINEANLEYLSHFTLDEDFVQRVVHVLKSQTSLPATTLPKRGRKFQVDAIESKAGNKCAVLNLTSSKQINIPTSGRIVETRKKSVRQQEIGFRKRAPSPANDSSLGLHECSTVKKCMVDSSLQAFPESQGSDIGASTLKENAPAASGITAEHSKHVKDKESCHSKVEVMHLDNESLETVSDNCQAERGDILADKSNIQHSWHCDIVDDSCPSSPDENLNKRGKVAVRQTQPLLKQGNVKLSDNIISQPDRKRRQKVISEKLTSKAINTNEDPIARRTRRQKVQSP